jgi:hypothetical protein
MRHRPSCPLTKGVADGRISRLFINRAFLVGSLWIVGFIAYLGDAPGELVIATLLAGLVAGGIELRAANRRAGR